MTTSTLHVLAVVGSPSRHSSTRLALEFVAQQLAATQCQVDMLDFQREPLPLFDPEVSYRAPYYAPLRARVERADILLLATPDYHGSPSSTLKNFLDHFWREYAGKLFASIVGSHDKGLTVTDQLRTVARQAYAWYLPYAVAFHDAADFQEGGVMSEALRQRLTMMARDLRVYGQLLARQRQADLAGTEPGFLARYRPQPAPAASGPPTCTPVD